jgi:hypothetical protein
MERASILGSFADWIQKQQYVTSVQFNPLALTVQSTDSPPETIFVIIREELLLEALPEYLESAKAIWPHWNGLEPAWSLLDTHLCETLDTCSRGTRTINFLGTKVGPDEFGLQDATLWKFEAEPV